MATAASESVKTGIVRERRKNGDTYIYERKTKYDPVRRFNVTVSKTLIGKIPYGQTEMVSTRPKRKSNPDEGGDTTMAPAGEASGQHTGMIDIIRHVSRKSGVEDEILSAIKDDQGFAQKFLTLVWYAFATDGETWPGVCRWSAKYAGLLPYKSAPVTGDMCHDLLVRLGQSESIRQAIFRHRADAMRGGELLALDTTTIATESASLNVGREEPHKDKPVKNVYKIVEIYSITSRQFVAYARIPGNIADGTTVEHALNQLKAPGISKVEIVADSGYSDEANMAAMMKNGCPFILRVPCHVRWIQPLIEQNREQLSTGCGMLHCDPRFSGITVMQMHGFPYTRQRAGRKSNLKKGDTEVQQRRLYVHIYYSSAKKAEEDVKFREQFDAVRSDLLSGAYLDASDLEFAQKYMMIRRMGDKVLDVQLNEKEYMKQSRYHGFLVLVARKEKDADRALEKYRAREYAEEDFKNCRSHNGGILPGKWNEDTLDGQMLVQFLAQSMRESFMSMLRNLKETLAIPNGDARHDTTERMKLEKALKDWLRRTPAHDILDWFDAIETTGGSGSKSDPWQSETTERDQLFFEKLGIHKTD